ncbi:uncharacterized protein [Venturia canescens]|uniref:uncharacterized protein n=1 Tax=Venturia canescens TaxID=32260 RepID=UPI001C9CE7E0|nr:uncharacterized protein LOC122417459 [Venturia canescens]
MKSVKCISSFIVQEFSLPETFDYSNVTSILVTGCVDASLNFSSFSGSKKISNIVVQNISGRLAFQPFAKLQKFRIFKLVRIRKILLIAPDTFPSFSNIENFHIEDTWIENFEDQFTNINVTYLKMKNVTIDRMIGMNLSERGKCLTIHDSVIKSVQTTLNFAFFSKIDIRNSGFELQKPGHLSIEGNSAIVLNSVFTNVSMNLVASDITINGSCADGKSSLRLSANRIESSHNRLPTEIIYTRNLVPRDNDTDFPLIVNNTVCIAGNCKCPKSNGHNSYERFHANIYLGMLLFFLVPGLL